MLSINTLAARAYGNEGNVYDAICNILENMEQHFTIGPNGEYQVLNPTRREENFADRWIAEPKRKDSFFRWLQMAKKDIVEDPLNFIDGLDSLKSRLSESFGAQVTQDTFEAYGRTMLDNRVNNRIGVNSKGNLTNKKSSAIIPVTNHTFFGSV